SIISLPFAWWRMREPKKPKVTHADGARLVVVDGQVMQARAALSTGTFGAAAQIAEAMMNPARLAANGCRLNFTTDGPRVYRRIGNFLLNVHRPGRSRSQGGAGPGEVGMARPALVVVSGNPGTLTALEQELRRRYGADYQVLAVAAPAAALAALEQLSEASDQVALLMADQCLRGMAGVEFLSQAHQLHPAAKRVLLITYGDVAAWVSGLQAMALGQLDYWLNAPWGPPELQLYPAVSELLGQWARATASAGLPPELVRVIGPRWSARSHELRDLLGRNNIPHGFYDVEAEDGRRLLAQARVEAAAQPVLVLSDGQVLADPTNEQLARALGVPTRPTPGGYDVAVVGAGPAGLAAATYAASEGLRTLLLERRATGRQAGTTSMIRNYLGFPRGISGGELATPATP